MSAGFEIKIAVSGFASRRSAVTTQIQTMLEQYELEDDVDERDDSADKIMFASGSYVSGNVAMMERLGAELMAMARGGLDIRFSWRTDMNGPDEEWVNSRYVDGALVKAR